MSADTEGATKDLKRAEALFPKADFVSRNRAALEYSHGTTVAQVGAASSSN